MERLIHRISVSWLGHKDRFATDLAGACAIVAEYCMSEGREPEIDEFGLSGTPTPSRGEGEVVLENECYGEGRWERANWRFKGDEAPKYEGAIVVSYQTADPKRPRTAHPPVKRCVRYVAVRASDVGATWFDLSAVGIERAGVEQTARAWDEKHLIDKNGIRFVRVARIEVREIDE